MPRKTNAKKKEETLDMWRIKEQMQHPTPRQEAIGKVMDEMKKDGVEIPTANGNKVVHVGAATWLDIVVKRGRTKKKLKTSLLTFDEKKIIEFYERRVKELMAKK